MIVRGVEMALVELEAQVGYGAPNWYSASARLTGRLCPSCDLGLQYTCTCPPFCRPRDRIITLPSL